MISCAEEQRNSPQRSTQHPISPEPNMNMKAKPSFKDARRQSGVTMLELLLAIAISAILLGVALPNLQAVMKSNQISAEANEFIGTLQLARNEAASRGKAVTIVAASPVTLNEFGGGWTVWADANSDGALSAGETMQIQVALKGGNTLDSLENVSSFRFSPSGFLMPAGANTSLSFRLCSTLTGQQGRLIRISASGRVDNSIINPGASCP